MKRSRLAILLGVLPLVSACADQLPTSQDAFAATSMNKVEGKARPFSGRCDGATTFAPSQQDDPQPSLRLSITYVCQLSHLGRTTAVANELIVFTGLSTGDATRTTVYTAANGDELHATWTGSGVTDAFGGVAFSGIEVYTGGTGRFVNASGSSALAGTSTFAGPQPLAGQQTFKGTLSY